MQRPDTPDRPDRSESRPPRRTGFGIGRLLEPERWSNWIHRRAGAIVLVAAILTVVAAALASSLRVDQRLRELLPSDAESVRRLDRVSEVIGSQSDLFVTIRSPSREANVAFGEAATARLAALSEIPEIEFRRDLDFFEERALLFASLGDLLDLRRRVILEIRAAVRKRAFGDFGSDGARGTVDGEPQANAFADTGLDSIRERVEAEQGSEYMEADEGRVMLVRLRPDRPSTDLEFAEQLTADVESLVAELEPPRFHPEMTVTLDGSYVQHAKKAQELRSEVRGGTVAALLALISALALYFRNGRAIGLLFAPLLASAVGALAYARVVLGELNLVSAFIFAILLGLGIDFGIHLLSRYSSERAAGADPEAALATTFATTGRATVAGGVSTILGFSTLMAADFRGFSEFGHIAAVGILIALVSALIVMPALLVVGDRIRPWRWVSRPPARIAPWLAAVGRVVAVVSLVGGMAAAVWTVPRIGSIAFEHDLRRLDSPNRSSPSQGSSYRDAAGLQHSVDPILAWGQSDRTVEAIHRQFEALQAMTPAEVAAFDATRPPTRPLTAEVEEPVVALPDLEGDFEDDERDFGDADLNDPRFAALEAVAVTEALMSSETAQELAHYGNERLEVMRERLRGIWSIYTFLPRQQDEKLAVIEDIRIRLEAKREFLSAGTKADFERWHPQLKVDAPITLANLPDWTRARFHDRTGNTGRYVVIATGGSKADADNARKLYAAFSTLRAGSETVETAAEFYVIADIFDTLERDGPLVMFLALLATLGATFVLLRKWTGVAAVGLTVSFAFIWLFGVMLALGWSLNIFNVIVFPLLLGMAEDNGLHIAERFDEIGGRDMTRVLRDAGGPIFMTTITTVFGFGGILFTEHRGLRSMAWIAVIGMSFALLASVVVLPPLLRFAERRRIGAKLSASRRPAPLP